MSQQTLTLEDKICVMCGCIYPGRYITPVITDAGPVTSCPFCADVIYGDHLLPNKYLEEVYYPFKHWLNTEQGRWYVDKNRWERIQMFSYRNPDTEIEEIKMVIHPVRCSFVKVFTPAPKPNSNDKQYTLVAMIPKDNAELVKIVQTAQNTAIAKGIEIGKFTKAQAAGSKFKRIIRDGDQEVKEESKGPEFKNMLFFSCNRSEDKGAPQVVMRDPDSGQMVPILNPDDFYSGVWAALDINFYPYNAGGSIGVAVGLNNCMKWKDDDRLDGRQSAEQAFGDLPGELDSTDPKADDGDFLT